MALNDAEMLFLYDAQNANPNGDPDDEDRPRMDELTHRLLVSDVRLKRYLRDYWLAQQPDVAQRLEQGKEIWVRRGDDGQPQEAADRYDELTTQHEGQDDFWNWFLERLIDVRLFGATVVTGRRGGGSRGSTVPIPGPVQFQWGYSLHPVEMNRSVTLSSNFAAGESQGEERHGTFGKDWRVLYALIGFWGRVSGARAESTRLQQADLEELESAMLQSLMSQATTRSKLGQTPRLYLKVDWAGTPPPFGDPRDHVQFLDGTGTPIEFPESGANPAARWRKPQDYTLDLNRLAEKLGNYTDRIARVHFWRHPDMHLSGEEAITALPNVRQIEV